ncbi:MAG TPA: hypothetical protein G4N98_01700 [Thermoflexia bacterium]|nr:hypothetical protein [Thermoflexia bacterium]
MSHQRRNLLIFIAMQVLAVIIYPPSFFASSPQAAISPSALLLFIAVVLLAMNTKTFSLENGRDSLAFIQGINITVRLMMLFPNLYDAAGNLHLLLFVTQLLGIGLSWYAISILEKWRSAQLLFKKQKV